MILDSRPLILLVRVRLVYLETIVYLETVVYLETTLTAVLERKRVI